VAPPIAPFVYRAQLATLVDEAPSDPRFIHELKYDGYRIGCIIQRGEVRLESRRGNDWTAQFPELVAAAEKLSVRDAMLDGEVAIVLPDGRTSFQALQNAFAGSPRQGLTYFVFDLLYLDGQSLAELPLEQRKARCEELLRPLKGDQIRFSPHFDADGPTVFQRACALGAEGIVSKRRDRAHRPGRNKDWLKTKCVKRQELVIGGFTDPEGSRSGVGSFLVGYYEGDALRFGGKVGTGPGFTQSFLRDARRKLEAIEVERCPFEPPPPGWLGRHAHWVEPELVAEVVFTEWTEGGHVRHGSFQGFRADKRPRAVFRESPTPGRETERSAEAARPTAPPRRAGAPVAGVTLTNPDRMFYPELGLTKLDVARYYAAVAEHMLPYVASRPLTLVRCDKGVRSAEALRSDCKFLRHEPGWHRWAKPPISRVSIQEQKKVGEYLVVDSPEGLVALAQGDILEVHVWGSTTRDLETPDRVVFDLDPGSAVAWSDVIAAARLLKSELERVDLKSWVKLTGGKGLHVVVPFKAELGWEEVFAFSRAVAESLARKNPASFTLEYGKRGRDGKILIDYKRNHRAAVAVAAYSARAHPNATLSMPIGWRELDPTLGPNAFTILNVSSRLAGRRVDPWRGFWTSSQRLSKRATSALLP